MNQQPLPSTTDQAKLNLTQQQICEVTTAMAKMLIEKNRSYGDSALSPIRIFSKLSAEESIKIRIDDKLSRIALGTGFGNEDAEWDLMGYLVLLRIAKQRAAGELADKSQAAQRYHANRPFDCID